MNKLIIAIIAGIAALFVTACSTGTALEHTLGNGASSASSPVFYGYKTPVEEEVEFYFSREVKVTSMYFDPPMETEIRSQGKTVVVRFNPRGQALPGGSKVTADLLVEDKDRNTLNVLVSFRTRNSRAPDLVINEVRTILASPKVEFVELKTLSPGNLGALRLFAAYEMEEPIFEFPPVEVKAGEYIVVHTRSIEPGIADETGTDLTASKGTEAATTARDFWISGTLKLHSTNAICVKDQDDNIIDGVLLLSADYKWKDSVAAAAEEIARQEKWSGSAAGHAVKTDGTSVTRTICRDESRKNSHSAADWYITVTSGATPGTPNNPDRLK